MALYATARSGSACIDELPFDYILDTGSSVFATPHRRNLLEHTIRAGKTPIKTGGGVTTAREYGAAYMTTACTRRTIFASRVYVMPELDVTIFPVSHFEKLGCAVLFKDGACEVKDPSGKMLIVARRERGLYRSTLKFRSAQLKPEALRRVGEAIRCSYLFCDSSHVHQPYQLAAVDSMHVEQVLPRRPATEDVQPNSAGSTVLRKHTDGGSTKACTPTVLFQLPASSATSYASQLLLAHKMFGHLNFRDLRKAFAWPATGPDPECAVCKATKIKQAPQPKKSEKRSHYQGHRLHLDIFFTMDRRPWQMAVDDYTRRSWVQELTSKADVFRKYAALVQFIQTAMFPMRHAVVRTDAEPVYNTKEWEAYCEANGIQHEVSAPYTHSQNGVVERCIGTVGVAARTMMVEGQAPPREYEWALRHANFCRQFAPTKANPKGMSPMARWEGNDELKPSSRILKAVLFCLVDVYIHKDERAKFDDRSYPAIYLGVDQQHSAFIVRALHDNKTYYSSSLSVHPHTFPYRTKLLKQPVSDRRVHFEGAKDEQPLQSKVPSPTQSVSCTPEAWHNTQANEPPENGDGDSGNDCGTETVTENIAPAPRRSQRKREPTAKALEAIASYHMVQHDTPRSLQQALAGPEAEEWQQAYEKEMKSIKEHNTLRPVKLEDGMRVFKAKLLFKIKPDGTKKVRAVVQAFKRMFRKGVDFEEKYAGTTRWNTVTLVLTVAVHFDYKLYLIDIKTFFLNSELKEKEQIYMERIEGQQIPDGFVNKVEGSLYGHPTSAYNSKQKLHKNLTKDGLFKQTQYDSCLYVLQHETERFWLPVHVDDMPCSGTKGGLELTVKRLQEAFEITVEEEPTRLLGVQIERDRKAGKLKMHQGEYIRELLQSYGMNDCKPRATPLESSVMGKIKQELAEGKLDEPRGREKEFNQFQGKVMWLHKTRPDLQFATSLMSRFLRCAGDEQMNWAKQIMRYLKGDPERGIILEPGPTLWLHGASDSDWGGEARSSKSTGGGYLMLGKQALVSWFCALQRKVADSSAQSETYAAQRLVREVIEVHGKLKEMGIEVPLPVRLLQDNQSVIKNSKNPLAHAASKHYRIPQAFIRGEVEDGLIEFEYVESSKNPADLFTKPSMPMKFQHDIDALMGVQGSSSEGACQRK